MINGKRYNDSMNALAKLGELLYDYNQEYTDDDLEKILMDITLNLNEVKFEVGDNDVVLFYDGFGLDTRGLAAIYLDALVELSYKIVYVVPSKAKGKIPVLGNILKKGKAIVCYCEYLEELEKYYFLCSVINKYKPGIGFLYTTPYDIAGVVTFMKLNKVMRRYLINLTDHAFWLGRNSFDYLLEFRDYGANISNRYRKIACDKLIRIEFYPYVGEYIPFAGYPFIKGDNDFIVFSGGFLYKTIDTENTYYKLVDYMLSKHENVKFWYAGYGDNSFILELVKKYPNRVYHTGERKDLLEIMKNIDLYLDTYPLSGGLMVQFSAVAGRALISLKNDANGGGFLINQENIGVEYAGIDEFKKAVDRFIEDYDFKKIIERNIKNSVISRSEFITKVKKIIKYPQPSKFINMNVNIDDFRRGYLQRFLKKYK